MTEVTIFVDGVAVVAEAGRPLGALMHRLGPAMRRTREGAPRGLFCGMGVCFDCLVTVDGVADRRACMTPIRDGMRIETSLASGNPS
ncbi:(2Fe-2S)-binding protein [Kaistia geumhonensis]|uniref:Molibdopterin-dependent oxidoreductase YjgC n=1 Tax=Kaistia geumhonensis TaxID=410839 RepID=A0ABU0M1C6_9HYPH|nr:(2Fe-2S)-binding protein [Kaistia geumhonensis]MCX5480018.1 (2Fe-2S)-binding protein [Kaistia geumhonensis]MDQ0514754.1 putative molibdopterin-dependent oxidoreductase YjgC [Kaistia geumhonensis]